MNCDQCQGDMFILGVLGNMAHFRCRHCGADQAVELDEDEKKEIKEELATTEN